MSRRHLVGIITRLSVAGIMFGILFMIQPFFFELFKPGFLILLFSTIVFTVISHIPEPSSAAADPRVLEDAPIRLSQPENS